MVARLLSESADPCLPWHRVLRSDGKIAFPPGHAHFDEQTRRLLAEGVVVENGRVRGQRAAPSLDQLLWGSPVDEAKKPRS